MHIPWICFVPSKAVERNLLMKFDGPFEISQKISPLAYRLCMPVSYGMNPVVNIAHLEPYHSSPPEFGERSKRHLRRKDFEDLPSWRLPRSYKNVNARSGGASEELLSSSPASKATGLNLMSGSHVYSSKTHQKSCVLGATVRW